MNPPQERKRVSNPKPNVSRGTDAGLPPPATKSTRSGFNSKQLL